MTYSRFLGIGSYVPPRVWTNQDLTRLMDTSDEWIQQRTGIKQRHWVEGTTTTSDLALEASKRALESANVKKEEIDLIILATLSPDHDFPGTACFLQAKLGVPGIPAIYLRRFGRRQFHPERHVPKDLGCRGGGSFEGPR